jgi:FlaG/FlaF family flagellin (archaellin)
VISTVLLVAIVAILGSVIFVFVLSLAGSVTQTAPTASFETKSSAAGVTLIHRSGDELSASKLTLVTDEKRVDVSALVSQDTIQAGDTIGPINPGESADIKLVWESEGASNVIYSATRYDGGIFLPDPIGHWRLDDIEDGTAEDSSRNSFDGTVKGSLTAAPGKLGQAAEFDGSSGQIIKIGDNKQFEETSFSISAWIYRSGGTNTNIVSKWRDDYTFEINKSGELRAAIDDNDPGGAKILDSDKKLPTGEWRHVAFTYNSSANEIRTYIDGTETASSPLSTTTIQTGSAKLAIGAQTSPNKDSKVFNGRIDDVRFYKQALSAKQIDVLYDATK